MADDLVERLYHIADKPWDLGNQEISAAAGEAAAEIARLRVHEHELGELLAVIFRDGGHHQAAVNDTHEAVAEAIQIVAQDRERPGWREGVEAAATSLDESAETLEEDAPGSVTASTIARIYREKAAAIRALKEPT